MDVALVETYDEDFAWMLRGEPVLHRGLTLPPGGIDTPIVLEIVRAMTQSLHEANCHASWMIVSNNEVVGLCSYRRPPKDGKVEIGYGVAESRRNAGHATRAVAAMLQMAEADPNVRVVTAETSVSNPASSRVLEKNGFMRTGTCLDPEDGEVITWSRASCAVSLQMEIDRIFGQQGYKIRFDWGIEGLEALASTSDVLIVVDTLSFSTAVNVAVERGAFVYPYSFDQESAARFAESQGALLAVKRGDISQEHPYSLSPVSLQAIEKSARLVLPSPNGSTLCARAVELGVTMLVAGSLRNASASARVAERSGKTISVIAAGERWSNGAMRAAIEDYLGAGAILNALSESLSFSPEAAACKLLFASLGTALNETVEQCVSGQELMALGYEEDVRLAMDYNASSCAAVFRRDHFVGVY